MYIGRKCNTILGVLILNILFISLLTISPLQQSIVVEALQPSSTNISNITVSLEVLRNMLSRALTLNISDGLRKEIEKFLTSTSNISSLSIEQINKFIKEGGNLLKEVGNEVSAISTYRYEIEERYTLQLRSTLENRIRQMARLYNLSENYLTNILANISNIKSIKDIAKTLSEINKIIAPLRYKEFGESIVKININIIEKGLKDIKNLDKAYKELSKIEELLNKSIDKFKKMNASYIAIENLEEAIEKISVARQIVANVTKIVIREGVGKAREALNKSLDEIRTRINETIEELRDELIELRDRAIETNITNLIDRIDQLLQRLENISNALAAHNISIDKALDILAKTKYEIKKIEESLEKEIKKVPIRDIERAFNVALSRAEKLVDEINQMVEFINNTSRDIVCIQVYPPPLICNKEYINKMLKLANSSVELAQQLIVNATELFNNDQKVEALIMLERANAILSRTKAWLEPLYNMFRMYERKEGKVIPQNITKSYEETEKRYNETLEKFNNLYNKIQNYKGSLKSTLTRILNDTKTQLREVYNLINKAKEYIAKGDEDKALENIAKANTILNNIAMKLENIEKIIS